jgi:hypothetical protein
LDLPIDHATYFGDRKRRNIKLDDQPYKSLEVQEKHNRNSGLLPEVKRADMDSTRVKKQVPFEDM